MRWDRNYNSPNVEDRRAAGPARGIGGGLPLGSLLAVGSRFGWKGILVAVVLAGALAYGGGTSMCAGGGPSSSGVTTSQPGGPAPQDEMAKFVGFVLDDAQATFAKQMKGYETTRLVLFRGAVNSACGTASSAVGPFYCPGDHMVYIDLDFYDMLRDRFDAAGDFAQAYVIAHEVGHHLQNITGKLGRGEVNQIETELQADCAAGAWAKDVERRGKLEVGDIDEALNAAAQIGDDTIQRKTQGRVQPETWTHGSAAQRSAAFKKGFQSGLAACGF